MLSFKKKHFTLQNWVYVIFQKHIKKGEIMITSLKSDTWANAFGKDCDFLFLPLSLGRNGSNAVFCQMAS